MTVATAWDRVERWLAANAADVLASLRLPATGEDVAAVAAAVGTALPSDYVASAGRHDGQDDRADSGLFPWSD